MELITVDCGAGPTGSDARASERHMRYAGLDSIRFLCALWVVISHFPLSIEQLVDRREPFGFIFLGVYNNAFSGPAAVIVFFVISGLCIHLPHRQSLEINGLAAYYLRRLIRIALPMTAAVLISQKIFGYNLDVFENSILWSLVAELVYYTIYPLLLICRRFIGGWEGILLLAFVASIMVAFSNPTAGNYPSFGRELNWLLGLPCWLLGCLLAEQLVAKPKVRIGAEIWLWRLGVWVLSLLCSVLRFHSPLGYPWTLNFFALGVVVWLFMELTYFCDAKPLKVLEWAGSWSYSLYLLHTLLIWIWLSKLASLPVGIISWASGLAFVAACAILFAYVVEFPSHTLARLAARSMQRKAAK